MMKVMLKYTPSLSMERADLLVAEIMSDLTTDCPRESARYNDSDLETSDDKKDRPTVNNGSTRSSNSSSSSSGNSAVSGSQYSSGNRTDPVLTKDAWCNYMASWLQVRDIQGWFGGGRDRFKDRWRTMDKLFRSQILFF